MPRLNCTFRQFIEILLAHGFELLRHDGGSHRRYRGVVEGKVHLVDVAAHNVNDHPRPGTLKAMIRQSGLPKRLFRR